MAKIFLSYDLPNIESKNPTNPDKIYYKMMEKGKILE